MMNMIYIWLSTLSSVSDSAACFSHSVSDDTLDVFLVSMRTAPTASTGQCSGGGGSVMILLQCVLWGWGRHRPRPQNNAAVAAAWHRGAELYWHLNVSPVWASLNEFLGLWPIASGWTCGWQANYTLRIPGCSSWLFIKICFNLDESILNFHKTNSSWGDIEVMSL